MLGAQAAAAVGAHQVIVDHRADVGVAQQFQCVQLMRSSESVEEVHERHAGFQGGHLRQQRAIVGLLHRGRAQQREPGRPHRHDVGVVAENRQRRGRQRTRRDMKNGRVQLPGDLEHVRQHQHQPLRGRERRGHRA